MILWLMKERRRSSAYCVKIPGNETKRTGEESIDSNVLTRIVATTYPAPYLIREVRLGRDDSSGRCTSANHRISCSIVHINDLLSEYSLHENSYDRLSAELCCACNTLGGLGLEKLNNASHRVNRRESVSVVATAKDARRLKEDARREFRRMEMTFLRQLCSLAVGFARRQPAPRRQHQPRRKFSKA